MGVPTKQKKIKPAQDIPYASASLCVTTEDIAAGELVYVSGRTGATREVTLADASSAVSSAGSLLIAKHATPSGARGIFLPWQNVTGRDTSGQALGDAAYLSGATPGGTVFVPSAGSEVRRQVGTVRNVDATDGVIDYDLSGQGAVVAGTGVAPPVLVHNIAVAAGGATTVTVPEGQLILDIWAVMSVTDVAETLTVTNDGDTVLSQTTGGATIGDVVRADSLLFRVITAGNDLVVDFSGGTLAGTVYVQVVRV